MDGGGTPLGVALSPADRHDSKALAATLDAAPPVRRGRGRPRRRPDKPRGDKGHDHRSRRADCRRRGVAPRIARRGVESGARLGRHRWKAERTLAWLNRFRRPTIRYGRREGTHLAFAALGCALVRPNQIRRLC